MQSDDVSVPEAAEYAGDVIDRIAAAVVAGRDYVTPDDVKFVADPVIRHRIVLTPEANIQGATKADVVDAALASVDVPNVTGT